MSEWDSKEFDSNEESGGEIELTNSRAPRSAWKPGQCGNPMGRPKGSRNKHAILRNELYRFVEESPGGMKAFLAKVFQEQPVEYLRLMVKLEPRERFVHQESKRLVLNFVQAIPPRTTTLPTCESAGSTGE